VGNIEKYRRYNASEKGLARKRRYYRRLKEHFNYYGDPQKILAGLQFIEAFQQGRYKIVEIDERFSK